MTQPDVVIPRWFIMLISLVAVVGSAIVGATVAAVRINAQVTQNSLTIADLKTADVQMRNSIQGLEASRQRDVLIDYRLCRIEVALRIRPTSDGCVQ